ncbi:MAG: biopolymer transporter ExbD [Sumerlaeia bacterium]
MLHRRPTRPRRGRSRAFAGDLNLTPLIDILFNLIFFFILATEIQDRERFRDIALPPSSSASAEKPYEDEPPPEVALDRDGQIYFDGEALSDSEFIDRMTQFVRDRKVDEIILSSDAGLNWGRIVEVTDLCQQAGVREVISRLRRAQN